MANRQVPTRLVAAVTRPCNALSKPQFYPARHLVTVSNATDPPEDVSPSSSFTSPPTFVSRTPNKKTKYFNPVETSRRRSKQLPPSRYRFRPPKHYRGPLHPHQPPPPSDPASRLFTPGPFSLPRLSQTYTSTLAPDLMTLAYVHQPPGTLPGPSGPRLRTWDPAQSPYYVNRPLRPPPGKSNRLDLLHHPVTFRNVPSLSKIFVHAFTPDAPSNSAYLHVAGMITRAITGAQVRVQRSKQPRGDFKIRVGSAVAVVAELSGEAMWGFMSKVVEMVLPRIKEWKGVSGRSGDGNGNLALSLSGEVVAMFPEVEVNYDAYPSQMIPKIQIVINTTATTDKEGRLLLSSMGIPFYGKHVN